MMLYYEKGYNTLFGKLSNKEMSEICIKQNGNEGISHELECNIKIYLIELIADGKIDNCMQGYEYICHQLSTRSDKF